MTTGTIIWLSVLTLWVLLNTISTKKNLRKIVKTKYDLDMYILKNKSLK